MSTYSLAVILPDGTFADKEIAVRIRSNSHYRISVRQTLLLKQSSRNAYRFVSRKGLLGNMGRLWHFTVRDIYARTVLCYGRITSQNDHSTLKGTFILSFCKKRKDIFKMKKTLRTTLSITLSLLFIICAVSCNTQNTTTPTTEAPVTNNSDTSTGDSTDTGESGNTVEKTGVWSNATYLKDMAFGNGAKTIVVEVKANEQSIKLTIKTDKSTVGEALLEHGLIAGEEGQYGLYVKVVNGMTADYDIDQSYWSFYINGEYAMTGVDSTEITDGATYQLEYAK